VNELETDVVVNSRKTDTVILRKMTIFDSVK